MGADARRLALVIGNNNYPWKPLANAVNDAQSLAGLLPQLGFAPQDITLATNTSLRQLQRVTREFLEKVKPGDVALVFYSGHGVEMGGINYLVPVDFPSSASDLELQDDAYPAQQLLRNLEATQARVRLMILDACRDNPLRATRSAGGGLARMEGQGTLVMFATGAGSTADDNPKSGNGLFTSHLLRALPTPGVSVDQLMKQVAREVNQESGGRQTPAIYGLLLEDFAFVRGTLSAQSSAPPPDPAREAWDRVRGSGNRAMLEALVREFPDSPYARLARVEIAGLMTAAPPAVTNAPAAGSAPGSTGYRVIGKIRIGGPGGWDYVTVDSAARRIYASHATEVDVIDADARKMIGSIADLHGVHGIAIAPDLGKGFVTNGQTNIVTVFDLKTLAKIADLTAGKNPDAICYEPKTRRVVTVNHSGTDATLFDGATLSRIADVTIGPTGEYCAVDGAGKVYVNLEASSEIVEIDAGASRVTRRASLAPCESPSGLAIDVKGRKLFPVCSNKMMAVVDIPSMKVIATPSIGAGTDSSGFDPGTGYAFSANGGDGTLTIVALVNGRYQAIENVPTTRGARTMAVDERTHHVLLLAAEYGPTPESQPGRKSRPPLVPDSFHVLVVGK